MKNVAMIEKNGFQKCFLCENEKKFIELTVWLYALVATASRFSVCLLLLGLVWLTQIVVPLSIQKMYVDCWCDVWKENTLFVSLSLSLCVMLLLLLLLWCSAWVWVSARESLCVCECCLGGLWCIHGNVLNEWLRSDTLKTKRILFRRENISLLFIFLDITLFMFLFCASSARQTSSFISLYFCNTDGEERSKINGFFYFILISGLSAVADSFPSFTFILLY